MRCTAPLLGRRANGEEGRAGEDTGPYRCGVLLEISGERTRRAGVVAPYGVRPSEIGGGRGEGFDGPSQCWESGRTVYAPAEVGIVRWSIDRISALPKCVATKHGGICGTGLAIWLTSSGDKSWRGRQSGSGGLSYG